MPDENLLGGSIGRYRIVSRLGRGGMGEVYLAEDGDLERRVALKVLLPEVAANEERVRRFVQEAKAASALNHPNILTVHEIGTIDGSRYIVTEYIKGETLRDRLSREPLSLRETLDVTLQVAAALSAAHGAYIVHRDIKPENIMLRDDGFVKVLDFGLAKLNDISAKTSEPNDATRPQVNTAPGAVMGTSDYMSPEQARGKETDARTDVWSLGIVLFEMLNGVSPFKGETVNDTIASILTKEPPPLDEEYPSELHRIIKRSLQKKADDRYQTVQDFHLDLRDLKRELEFSEELERSHIPSRTRAANVGLTASADSPTIMHSAAISTSETAAHQPSSAEYIVSGIMQHKRSVLGVLGVLLVALIGAGAYFIWFASPVDAAIKSVAVLPFVNASNDPDQEYLADGISEGLINNLSQLKDLKVIARTSTFQYKGKEINLDEVAKTLGVEAVVTGRIVRRGDQLQISAELVKVSDKRQIWGETFSRAASAASSVEVEISKQIAESLKERLTNTEQLRIAKNANIDPRAYDLFLRCDFFRLKTGNMKENLEKEIDLCNQAIAIEPNYAEAYLNISGAYSSLVALSLADPQIAGPKADAALKKALEIDPDLPEAMYRLGVRQGQEWKWAEAEQTFQRSLEVNPNLARSYAGYANLLSLLGRHDEALANLEKARQLDPTVLADIQQTGAAMFFAGRNAEAITWLKKALEIDPEQSIAHSFLGYVYLATKDYSQSIAQLNESMRIDGRNSSDLCYLGSALARAGRKNEALAVLHELETSKEYVSSEELAVLHTALGDKDRAFAMLEKAFTAHDQQLRFLGVDPALDDLRPDPRFNDLLRRVGLPTR